MALIRVATVIVIIITGKPKNDNDHRHIRELLNIGDTHDVCLLFLKLFFYFKIN